MSKRNKSHRKGVKTSNIEKRKAEKKQKYAALRESERGKEPGANVALGRGRNFTKSEHYCKHERRNERRANSLESKAECTKKPPGYRIAELDAFLGVGLGAKKERARLRAMLEGVQNA